MIIVAIVLGSGGTRGDFQAGALQFLYGRGIRPDAICGSSIGAINGLVLAEGGLEKLVALWLSFRDYRDMYVEEPWLRALAAGPLSSMAAPDAVSSIMSRMARYMLFPPALFFDAVNFWTGLAATHWQFKSLFNLSPTAAKLRARLDPSKVRSSGTRLRIATVNLESGELRYVTESGRFSEGKDQPVDLVDAVLASSAIPALFPPVKLHSENYIDGGVREMLPVQAAVDLGETEIYAIACSKPGVGRAPSFDNSNLMSIAARAAQDIMFDEIQRNETNPPRGWGADIRIIQPTMNIHGVLTVDPGLISISMAYGYMRAFDTVEGGGESLKKSSDEITRLRLRIWSAENTANGKPEERSYSFEPRPLPSSDYLLRVRKLKRDLKALVAERRRFGSDAVPHGAEVWWKQWERHGWTPLTPTPWSLADAVGEEEPL